MGLMDMLGGLLGRKSPKTGNGLLDALLGMLMKGGAVGGLAGLLGKFKNAGLGNKVDSWVSTGANQPLDPEEVQSALGGDVLNQMASKAGVSVDEAKGGLASMLPGLVDKLTPGGQLPTGALGGLLKKLDLSSILGGLGK